jgi:hypothetical protein
MKYNMVQQKSAYRIKVKVGTELFFRIMYNTAAPRSVLKKELEHSRAQKKGHCMIKHNSESRSVQDDNIQHSRVKKCF